MSELIPMQTLVNLLFFAIGMIVGMLMPFITIAVYNAIGKSLGDLCDRNEDEEEEDAEKDR